MATDDLQARQRRLERRQAMADALMAQSMQAPQGQMVSGHYVAPSPLEYLAKAGQQFLGRRSQANLDQQQTDLDTEQRQLMTTALQDYLNNRDSDPRSAATLAATSEYAPIQQLGMAELKELNKPETWKTGGTARDPATGELVDVLISNRGNQRRSEFASAPEMRVAGGEVYDPRSVQPGQRVGRDPGQLTPFQAEQLRMQQENLRSMIDARDQQAASNQQKADTAQRAEADRMASEMASTDASIALVEDMLKHPGRGAAVGTSSALPTLPGGEARDYELKVEQLKGSQFLQSIQQMRGLGQLSNAEGQAATRASTALDVAQSEAEHERELNRLLKILKDGRARKPGTFPAPGGTETAVEAVASDPSIDDLLQQYGGI